MKYIVILMSLLLISCVSWTPEDYDWKSDYFQKRYAVQEVEVPIPEREAKVECSNCICNMDLCT